MKSGAGDDPFADDPPGDEQEDELADDGDQDPDEGSEADPELADRPGPDEGAEPDDRPGPDDPPGPDDLLDDEREDADPTTAAVGGPPQSTGSEPQDDSPRETAAQRATATDSTEGSSAGRSGPPTGVDSASSSPDHADSADIPWVLRRGSVKDARPNMTQFFLRDATDRAEREFRSDVEDVLEKDVYLLDLREAAYLVAMEHPDEVAEVLREWGYDYL